MSAFDPFRTLASRRTVGSGLAVSNFHSRPRIYVKHGHARVELLRQGLVDPCAKTRLSPVLADGHSYSIVRHGQEPRPLVCRKRYLDLACSGPIRERVFDRVDHQFGNDQAHADRHVRVCGRIIRDRLESRQVAAWALWW